MAILDAKRIAVSITQATGTTRFTSIHGRSHILTFVIEGQCQAVRPVITTSDTPHHRQLPSSGDNIDRIALSLKQLQFTMEFEFGLEDRTDTECMFLPAMEELCSRTETDVAHTQVLILDGRVHIGFGKGQHTHVTQFAPHIIDIRTQRKPVTDIKTQTAIHLADVSFAAIVHRIMISSSSRRVRNRDVVSYGTIGLQTDGHRNPLFIERELHGDILEVSVSFVLLSAHIFISAPVGTSRNIKHEGKGIAGCVRSRLSRVDSAIITHTVTYSSHGAITHRYVIIHISVGITGERRARQVLSRHSDGPCQGEEE